MTLKSPVVLIVSMVKGQTLTVGVSVRDIFRVILKSG